jgi:hypothetical protein
MRFVKADASAGDWLNSFNKLFMHQNKLTISIIEKWLTASLLAGSLLLLLTASYHSLLIPLNYDEAYNLQVVDLLAKGQGYASYGALKGNGPWLFDPYITTGPVILGPLALLWRVTGGSIIAVRIFMLQFLWLYAFGWFYLLKSHKFGLMLAALAIGSSLCIIDMQSGQVLGELPAAAAIIWAAWAVSKNRPLIAAIMVGIAVQIKLVYGLAGLIVLLFFLVFSVLSKDGIKLKIIAVSSILLFAPTLLFELYRFVSFGSLDSYLFSLDELRRFLRTQDINNTGTWLNPNLLGSKFSELYRVLPVYAWLASGIALSLIIFGSTLQLSFEKDSVENRAFNVAGIFTERESYLLCVALASLIIGSIAMLCGWITLSVRPGKRQALPFLFLFIPGLFVLSGCHYFRLREKLSSIKWSTALLFVLLCCICFLLAALFVRSKFIFQNRSNIELLEEQKRVASILRQERPRSIFVDGWWQNPEYQILSGIPGIPWKTGKLQIMVVPDYQIWLTNTNWETYKKKCGEIIYSSSHTLLCRLPDFDYKDINLHVLDWGPRSTQAGIVPNRQPDGGVGVWIKIGKINIEDVGPVNVYFSGRPGDGNYMDSNGELIASSIPPRLFKKAGKYSVDLKQLSTGKMFHVGYFIVN